jgi:dTDP-glucose 4,6-dehydratase
MDIKSRILITGAAGFIGSNLLHHLSNLGFQHVVGIDNYSEGSNPDNLEGCNYLIYHCDIREEDQVKYIFDIESPEFVVHLAAASHVDRSINGDKIFWETNVVGSSNILRACRDYKVSKVIQQLTDEVWGSIPHESPWAKEGSTPKPTSPYPCSKTAQYYVGKSFYTTWGTPVVSTFPVNNFGPRQFEEKLIPKFIKLLLEGKKVPLMASTHFERDWLPVVDMCRALVLLLARGEPGEEYNVGAGNHHSNLALTHKLLKLCGRDESSIEIVPDRLAHDSRYAVNFDKIKELGYYPSEGFDSYLQKTVDWYQRRMGF